jgi:hypothetical protein
VKSAPWRSQEFSCRPLRSQPRNLARGSLTAINSLNLVPVKSQSLKLQPLVQVFLRVAPAKLTPVKSSSDSVQLSIMVLLKFTGTGLSMSTFVRSSPLSTFFLAASNASS